MLVGEPKIRHPGPEHLEAVVVKEEPATRRLARLEELQEHDPRAEVLSAYHEPGEVKCVLAVPKLVGVELLDFIFKL